MKCNRPPTSKWPEYIILVCGTYGSAADGVWVCLPFCQKSHFHRSWAGGRDKLRKGIKCDGTWDTSSLPNRAKDWDAFVNKECERSKYLLLI